MKSLKSPMNIDDSNIDKSSAEGKRFECIYNILKESSTFQKLFLNIFQNSERINVKFEIVDNLNTSQSPIQPTMGKCVYTPTNTANNYYATIKLNKNIFVEGVPSNFYSSDINVLQTILHECVHAYLGLIKLNSFGSFWVPENLDGLNIGQMLNLTYASYPQQHNFIYNNMLPMMNNCLKELRYHLITPDDAFYIEGGFSVVNPQTGQNELKNWNDFYTNVSLQGLNDSQSYINRMQNPGNLSQFQIYTTDALLMNKNCVNN